MLEFNKYIQNNYIKLYDELYNKYPKSRLTLDTDLSDAYREIIKRNPTTIKSWKGWIFQYIYNRHYRFFNKKIEFINIDNLYELTPEDEIYKYDEEYNILIEAYDCLSLDEKNLYDLYYINGLSGMEIANKLGVHHQTTYTKLREVKSKLKNECKRIIRKNKLDEL